MTTVYFICVHPAVDLVLAERERNCQVIGQIVCRNDRRERTGSCTSETGAQLRSRTGTCGRNLPNVGHCVDAVGDDALGFIFRRLLPRLLLGLVVVVLWPRSTLRDSDRFALDLRNQLLKSWLVESEVSFQSVETLRVEPLE